MIHYFQNQLINISKEKNKNKFVCTASNNFDQKKINFKIKKYLLINIKKEAAELL